MGATVAREQLEVHWTGETGATRHVGTLRLHGWAQAQEFTYASTWLAEGFSIGEGMPLVSGPLSPPGGLLTFGVFDDAGPDAWGRQVVQRARSVSEWGNSVGLLSATPDLPRQGALRFSDSVDGPFLREIEESSFPAGIDTLSAIQADISSFVNGSDDPALLRRLFAGSSSQGGARPKSAVISTDGRLLIAKFPAESDRYDVQACEAVALSIARETGLPTPAFQLERLDENRSILLLERFDRTDQGRLGYQSMRTASGMGPYEEFNYKMAVSTARRLAGKTAALSMVTAAALAICVNNFDDHARNFGFLRQAGTWRLAPIFDVVPFPYQESGTPLLLGEDHRSLEQLLDIDWGLPRQLVLEAVTRVAEVAWHAWDDAPSRFGLAEDQAVRMRDFLRSGCDYESVLRADGPRFPRR